MHKIPKIKSVKPNSLAALAGVRAGEVLQEINGQPVIDFLDYTYLSSDSHLVLELSDRMVEIDNPNYENLGLEFETMLIDEPRKCRNKCVFCFIDQNAPNMRESIYFKDDDYRLSFLQGNYISLTNLSDADISRIIEYNLPRINVSVHTTNPELRVKMLGNPNAGNVLEIMSKFVNAGISMNCQIVLCRGMNDGGELLRTIDELVSLAPAIESVSVVPVGLTKFRDGLPPLEMFDKASATAAVEAVERRQTELLDRIGTRFVYLGDEFYLLAEREIPPFDSYEEFLQIENGVGLMAAFKDEFVGADDPVRPQTKHPPLRDTIFAKESSKKSIVTGVAAYEFIKELTEQIAPQTEAFSIRNEFFGESITVAGLVTGQDIINQLRGRDLGDEILLPKCMLKADDTVFLDDVTVADVERELGVKVKVVPIDGSAFFEELKSSL